MEKQTPAPCYPDYAVGSTVRVTGRTFPTHFFEIGDTATVLDPSVKSIIGIAPGALVTERHVYIQSTTTGMMQVLAKDDVEAAE